MSRILTSHESVGPYTADKQDTYTQLLRMHMEMVSGIYGRREWVEKRYFLFDLNAGAGEVLDRGVAIPGSPLRAIELRTLTGVVLEPAFFESNASVRQELLGRLGPKDFGENVFGSNDEAGAVAGKLASGMPPGRKALGLIYADPPGTRIPVAAIQAILEVKCMEKLDVLCRVSANGAYKRPRASTQNGLYLSDDIRAIGKAHALIQAPAGRHQWTFLLLTNWVRFPEWRQRGFYRLDSPTGQEIFRRLNFTSRELDEQQALFEEPPYRTYAEYLRHPRFLAVREIVMDRANGKCERCGERPPRDPHHLRYPEWGTFDVPENLIALCRQCHCEVHGKER